MVAPVVIAAIGTAVSMAGQMKGARGARAAAREQAYLYNAQMLEEIRRKERSQAQTLGATKAGIYASGIHFSGTSQDYYQDMSEEMGREIEWMHRHRRMAMKAIKKGANIQYSAAQWQTAATGIQGAANAFQMYNQMRPPSQTTTTGNYAWKGSGGQSYNMAGGGGF